MCTMVLYIAATGETFGYYQDYADEPTPAALAQASCFKANICHIVVEIAAAPTRATYHRLCLRFLHSKS